MSQYSSVRQRNGRYACGGYTTPSGNKLGWWERTTFPKDHSDITLVLTRKYAHRPDILAYDVYGNASLQWLILQYNDISDVIDEFVENTSILLPTRNRVFGELLGSPQKPPRT